jgi:hypothetical protein
MCIDDVEDIRPPSIAIAPADLALDRGETIDLVEVGQVHYAVKDLICHDQLHAEHVIAIRGSYIVQLCGSPLLQGSLELQVHLSWDISTAIHFELVRSAW